MIYGRISCRFRAIDKQSYKVACFPQPRPPLLDAHTHLNLTRHNFWMKLTPQKLERWGYRRPTVKIS